MKVTALAQIEIVYDVDAPVDSKAYATELAESLLLSDLDRVGAKVIMSGFRYDDTQNKAKRRRRK